MFGHDVKVCSGIIASSSTDSAETSSQPFRLGLPTVAKTHFKLVVRSGLVRFLQESGRRSPKP